MTEHIDRPTDTAPLTEIRDNLSEAIDEVTAAGSDLVVTRHGRPVAVVVSYEDYESLIETLNILSDSETMSALDEARSEAETGDLATLE